MNLFEIINSKDNNNKPLAERIRPKKFEEIFGQNHLLDKESFFINMVNSKKIMPMILWGPPGSGKTTIAKLLSNFSNYDFHQISAAEVGIKEIKKVIDIARTKLVNGIKTILFVDEIHRFNRSQQDTFLGALEEGLVILIGATTENPSFELNNSLISRCHIFQLKSLNKTDLYGVLERALKLIDQDINLTQEGKDELVSQVDGDARFLVNILEILNSLEGQEIDRDEIKNIIGYRPLKYDKSQQEHYTLISALHKSIRGSDINASIYWLARMLIGGESPDYIFRRLLRVASEDIGMADPLVLGQILSAKQAFDVVGLPEGEIFLAQSVILLSSSLKSNTVYLALNDAKDYAKKNSSLPPQKHIINASNKFMENLGYGEGYVYDHSLPSGISGQNYFPSDLEYKIFYKPLNKGYEKLIKKRIAEWKEKITSND